MPIGWIDCNDYSFNSMLLLERFQIRLMVESCGWRKDNHDRKRDMSAALTAHPHVKWYLERRCPECAEAIGRLAADAPIIMDAAELRAAEVRILSSVEDFIVYTTPEVMAEKCDFIRGWNKERLFALAYFEGKTVLDVGAGSGRLAFAAAEKAAQVYAVEPVGTLREFMRDKAKREGVDNIRIADGFIESLPYPDCTFDIVLSGHVYGDHWDEEIAESERVCKPGGWLVDCPGDSTGHIKPKPELLVRGWEEVYYRGSFGFDVYCYRKQKPLTA
ncbi:hypothetical protein AGMMS49992_16200 [Clostridia bacterium]|nr:hypothetical protein AGMMS49992_16200 [Clostridia bacterium]